MFKVRKRSVWLTPRVWTPKSLLFFYTFSHTHTHTHTPQHCSLHCTHPFPKVLQFLLNWLQQPPSSSWAAGVWDWTRAPGVGVQNVIEWANRYPKEYVLILYSYSQHLYPSYVALKSIRVYDYNITLITQFKNIEAFHVLPQAWREMSFTYH
jgi:hypothetical protein